MLCVLEVAGQVKEVESVGGGGGVDGGGWFSCCVCVGESGG